MVAHRKLVLGTAFILIIIFSVADILTSMGISLKQKIPSQADWPETTTHPVGTDVWISATLEGTSETRTGEPEKENGEKSNGNLETTKTKTNSAVNEGRSKNATLTEEDETLTEEQGVHVLGSFFMPERSNMRYPEYGNMTAAEKVASEYVTREIHVTDYTYDPLATCSVTSQVRIIQKSSQWIMQSIDTNGNNKTVGGDEFYVTYTDNNPPHKGNHTAVALIKDLQNGLYQLTFKTTPTDPHPGNLTGVGTLSVRFLYSCNIGLAPRPVKDNWKAGGATLLIHHTKSNVTQPPIRTFRPPSGVGLSTFDLVVSFGDSMMETFVRSKTGNKAYHRRKTVWSNNPKSDLYSGSRSRLLEKLESWHGKQHLNRTNVALLLGSSAWDILRPSKPLPDFSDHIDTCRRFVRKVQDRYPNVTVIWKAPAAIHVEHWEFTTCTTNLRCLRRYAANSRVKYLYDEQMKIMKELNVPVMDVFEATYLSSDQHPAGDPLHYEAPFNKLILSYFYKSENRTQ